jgi:signal transduction histidine kinase
MHRTATTILVTTALWLIYGLIYAEQLVNLEASAEAPTPWSEALMISLFGMVACWVPLTLGIIWAVRRIPLERGRIAAAMVKLLAVVVAVFTLRAVFVAGLNPLLGWWYYEQPPFWDTLTHSASVNFMKSWLLIGAAYALVHWQNTQANRVRIAELESSLARARLDALSAQLNPHFLFNALNSIAELIHVDPEAADRMLVALSALLRFSLVSPEHEVRVDEEAALAAQYLAIEKIRLGDRLDVRWSVDPECGEALVPALILQPLAENAIVHGIARRRVPGTVHIAIRRNDTTLVIEVRDDGRSSDAPPRENGTGIGLNNTQARLRCLYGDNWALTLHTGVGEQSVVRVELPLRFVPAANDAPAPQALSVGAITR